MAGITDLQAPDPSDAVAWGAWARQQDPATYGWQNQRAIDQYSLPGLKPALEKAGLWNPAWNDFAANPEAYQAGSTGDGENAAWHPAEKEFNLDLSSLKGYTTGDQRSTDLTRLSALIDPKGNAVTTPEAYQGASSSSRGIINPLMFVAAPYLAPMIAGAAGGGMLGGAVAGGALGAGTSALKGDDRTDILKSGATGAVLGGIGGGISDYMSVPADPLGYDQSMIDLAKAGELNPGDFSSGIDSMQPHLTPAALESMMNTPGYGANASADAIVGEGNSGMNSQMGFDTIQNPALWDGTAPVTAGDTVNIEGQRLPADTNGRLSTDLPPLDYTIPDVGQQPIPDVQTTPSTTSSGLDGLKNWALTNPLQAISLASIIASKLKGGDPTGGPGTPGGPGTGPQAQMTATPAQGLGRQYVAPPAGYRPGFDPEHRYFTGIGAVGAGGASVPKTTQDTFPPGTQG
jgi:hypothetical protein